MGMVASLDNSYPKKIKVDISELKKQEVQKEAVDNVNADSLTVVRNKPVVKPQNRTRVVDEFPSVIKLVKYPSQPNFYPYNNYATPAPRKMFLHDDRINNGAGRTIMYNEPGLAGQRKMILYDPHSLQPPKKLVLYKPTEYSNTNHRIMNYYDQSVRDMNITTRNAGGRPIPQNLSYLSPSNRFSNDSYYNNYPQGFVDKRFYNGTHEGQPKGLGKLVSLPFKDTIIDEGGSGGTSLITVSNTPIRRNSDSAIQTTRELEVVTIDRFQDSTGKIYKIVKPVGERTRVVYTKPDNYDRLLIVETPGQGNYVISKAGEARPISDEVKSIPMEQTTPNDLESQFVLDEPELAPEVDSQIIPDELHVVFEEPQMVPEESKMVPEESKMVPDEPQMVTEDQQSVLEELQADYADEDLVPEEGAIQENRATVHHEKKLITKIASLATSSTQTNPKINYKKVDYHDNKSLRLRIDFTKNSAKS